jgi:hypothetical protein
LASKDPVDMSTGTYVVVSAVLMASRSGGPTAQPNENVSYSRHVAKQS